MARNKARPQGYVPFLEFYLRKKKEGGNVLVPSVFRGTVDARARRSCLVLVHGFNNTDSEAAAAYFGFRNRQTELTGAPPFTWDRYFGDSFWPGDADWWWIFDKADFLVYPAAVHRTPAAGEQLTNLLHAMPALERVDFIGHSLGCRVVLETLQRLVDAGMPRIDRVVLMAAAVRAEDLRPGGKYFDLMTRLQAGGTRVYVLHSVRDLVLMGAFPPGQALAGEPSLHALGRDGPDAAMPGYGSTLDDDRVEGAGHSSYWGHTKSAASDFATEKSGAFLKLGDVVREVGEARPLVAPIDALEARRLGSLRRAFDRVGI